MVGLSPQVVGHEFVRQYYTLLNQMPKHLHRFYAENSSFVHGRIEGDCVTAVGQRAIHACIQKMNLNVTKVKIRQIDSYATLSNGVVVQVCGEISNSDEPLRTFMQTFVLAPLDFKAFYVHNDIFRYEDVRGAAVGNPTEEVFSDETSQLDEYDVKSEFRTRQLSCSDDSVSQATPDAKVVMIETDHVQPDDDLGEPCPDRVPVDVMSKCEEGQPLEISAEQDAGGDGDQATKETHLEAIPQCVEVGSSSEVALTYATLVKAGKNLIPDRGVLPPAGFSKIATPVSNETSSAPTTNGKPLKDRDQRPNHDLSKSDGQDRRKYSGYFPDSRTIYVGSLPYQIIEDELRDLFGDFGEIEHIRLSRRDGGQTKFAFVIFREDSAALKCLSGGPFYKGNHQLLVERKRNPSSRQNGDISGERPRSRFSDRNGAGSPRHHFRFNRDNTSNANH